MASVSHRGVLNLAGKNTNIHIGKQRLAQTWTRSLGGEMFRCLITYSSTRIYMQTHKLWLKLLKIYFCGLPPSNIILYFNASKTFFFLLVIHQAVNDSAVGSSTYGQEITAQDRKPQHKAPQGTFDALTRRFCRGFIFNKSTAISDMDLFFTAKYNRFPVLLITSKHIMYIQLTSPLSHSQFLDWIGIIFQDFSSLQRNKTKQNESNRKK